MAPKTKVKSLTSCPVSLKEQMCPSTEPMTTQPAEPEGEEKKGVSWVCVHSTSPLSCNVSPVNERDPLGRLYPYGPSTSDQRRLIVALEGEDHQTTPAHYYHLY